MVNSHPVIDSILSSHRTELGNDLEKYRNHIYRVYNFTLLLGAESVDEEDKEKIAIAAAFHDLGIWSHHTFDYIQPSIEIMKAYLRKTKQEDWAEEISFIIREHHKVSPYYGPYDKTVEIFRKADWIDVSMRVFGFGLTRSQVSEIKSVFPFAGFHRFLVAQSLKNFAKHPANPLPMFKR